MPSIEFSMIITNEAVTYAREATTNPGWYLTPVKWAISSSKGNLTVERTTNSMFTPWIQQPFSGVRGTGTTKLLHSIVIPPDAYTTEMTIGEIYFIYKNYKNQEFLYAIAQPTSTLTFTPGVSQNYSFVFSLNNTTVADTFSIDYTYPQDIEDHNVNQTAHDNLLARSGVRTATGILKYSKAFTFTEAHSITDKKYVDDKATALQKNIDTGINNINTNINNMYCPPGTMMWWPKTSPPSGWLSRHGQAVSRTTYAKLFKVIGTTYGAGNGSTTFNLPDDRGIVIRGYLNGTTANFGQIQGQGLPNITGNIGAICYGGQADNNSTAASDGAFVRLGNNETGPRNNGTSRYGRVNFNANRSNGIYGAANEVRMRNRNYLPIIKF